MRFVFWYKKEIESPTLVGAIRKAPKVEFKLDSINQEDFSEKTPCVGFAVEQEDWEEDV